MQQDHPLYNAKSRKYQGVFEVKNIIVPFNYKIVKHVMQLKQSYVIL